MAGLLGFTLADLSGAVDSRKRQYANLVRGLLSDPGMTLAQLAQMDAEQTQRDRATLGNSRSVMPEVRQQAQEQDLMNTANAGGLLGMIAYHGSPHKFDKFDMSKIGTGEGAQAYGHGLYFAEQPDVAKAYAEVLGGGREYLLNGKQVSLKNYSPFDKSAFQAITDPQTYGSKTEWLKTLEDAGVYPERLQKFSQAYDNLAAQNPQTKIKRGNMYKVDIPDDAVSKMLDWDKPLSQQPESVRKALKEYRLPDVATGSQIYDMLKNRAMSSLDPSARKGLHEYATDAAFELRRLGIPGIRYLDAGSRVNGDAAKMLENYGTREKALEVAQKRLKSASFGDLRYWQQIIDDLGRSQSSNFVLFDDNLPKILSRE